MPKPPGDTMGLRKIASPHDTFAAAAELILQHDPRPGDRAPTETELADSLRISRQSARRTLDALGAAGIVADSRTGAKTLRRTGSGEISRFLGLVLKSENQPGKRDFLGVRIAVEQTSVAAAADSARNSDIRALRGLVLRMRKRSVTPAEFCRLDVAFHLRMAQTAGGLRESLLDGLAGSIHDEMEQAFDEDHDWESTATRLADEHEHLLRLVDSGRGAKASNFVSRHVERFYARKEGRHDG
ncbi:FadR family transcriptional regulator [Amycolatopsis acidicola]|uniref:FadR family transcriptional regulator n=1 Tax=Amycolatopsis acidicola TaxID=2596893 RepID=A0A5N0VCK6_9PSEU|nr:FCD domain-containing protein [Amycolatopsis acidicola]KAA9162621.1 FadR family transcriptional regulator [Amycolatopsis acidicola]